jgi:hypothetical protein
MIKLLKDAETRELEKHKKAEEEARRKIADIEAKRKQRENRITVNDSQYNKAVSEFNFRADVFASSQPAHVRFVKMLETTNWKALAYADYKQVFANFRFAKLMQFIDEHAEEPEKMPVKKTLSEIDLLED